MGEVADMYTQDGTVDRKGNPALKKDTGNWRACPYILGQYTPLLCFFPGIVHCCSALCLLCLFVCLFVVHSTDGS